MTVSSVWGVSSSPTVVNPMMPMQSGGGMTQGVGSQFDPSLEHVPIKNFPNQGIQISSVLLKSRTRCEEICVVFITNHSTSTIIRMHCRTSKTVLC